MSGLTFVLPDDALNALARRIVELTGSNALAAGESPYLTAAEAAEYLHVPRKRIYNLSSRREIPHRKQDGRLLFKRVELDAWIDQFYVGPAWAGPEASGDL
ncbi:MAG: helix-turn-helix domain-containing protein [Actinomycetota bacterium]